MRRFIFVVVAALMLCAAAHAQTETVCTAAAPCIQISGTDAGCAAVATPATSTTPYTAPCIITVWRCTGTLAVGCSSPTAGAWTALGPANAVSAGTVTWTAPSSAYFDNTVSYGVSYVYYLTAAWTAGQNSAPSELVAVVMPAAPVATLPVAPPVPKLTLAKVVTAWSGVQVAP